MAEGDIQLPGLAIPATIDLAPIGRAEPELNRRVERMGASAAAAYRRNFSNGAGRRAARDFTDGMERQFRLAQADISESLARGLITPREAERRGQQAGREYKQALLDEIRRRSMAGALSDRDFVDLTNRLGDAGQKAGDEFQGGFASGIRRLPGIVQGIVYGGVVAIAIEGLRRVGRAVADFGRLAGETNQLQRGFAALTAGRGLEASEVLSELRQATLGATDSTELMRRSNLLLNSELPLTAENVGELAFLSRRLAQSLGRDAADGFDRFSRGIVKMETELLDELGIMVRVDSAVRDWAEAHGIAESEMTDAQRQLALYTAVVEQARVKVAALGEEEVDTGIRVQQAAAFWDDLRRQVVLAIAEIPGIENFFNSIGVGATDAADRVQDLADRIAAFLERHGGGVGGALGGAVLGGIGGAAFGGVGAIPGAALGAIAGGATGELVEGIGGRRSTETILLVRQREREREELLRTLRTSTELKDLERERIRLHQRIAELQLAGRGYSQDARQAQEELAAVQAGIARATAEANENDRETTERLTAAQEKQADAARETLQERIRAFQALAPLREIQGAAPEVPEGLEAQLQRIYAIDTEIAAINREINDARGQAPAGIREIIAAREEERAVLLQNVAATRDQWDNLPEIEAQVTRVVESTQAIAGAAVDMGADGWQTLSGAIGGVTRALKESADAEAELQRARLAGDPQRIADALERQRRAQRDVADATEQTTRIFEAAAEQGIISQEQLNALIAEMVELLNQAGVSAEGFGESGRDWENIASTVEGIARGVLSVADALGTLSDEQEQVLRGFVDIAAAAGRIATGDWIGGIAQGVGGLIGVIQGAFGSEANPEDAARIERHRDAMRDLEVALLELRDAYLGNLSRTQLEEARQFAQNTAATLGADFGPGTLAAGPMLRGNAVFRRRLEELDEMFDLGLSQLLEDEDYAGLQKALEDLGGEIDVQIAKLGQFPETIAGIFDEIGFQFRALGNTDAAERLAAINERVKELGLSAGEFQDEIDRLSGLDLNTEAGQAERDRIIADIIEEMGRGAADPGDFTAAQFRDLIEQWGTAGVMPTPEAQGPEPIDTTAADTIARVRFELDALGETDAVVRIRTIVDALREAGVSFGEFGDELAALDALDLSTAEGQARQGEIIARIIRGMAAEGASFGGLSPDQLRQLVLDYARAAGNAAPEPEMETTSQGVDRGVTETTMRREVSILTTIAHHTQRTADLLAQMMGGATAMAAPSVGPIRPPSAAALSFGAGPQINYEIHLGDIEIPVQTLTQVDAATVRAWAGEITDVQIAKIDRYLADRRREYERGFGVNRAR